jgi:hypothetical protein
MLAFQVEKIDILIFSHFNLRVHLSARKIAMKLDDRRRSIFTWLILNQRQLYLLNFKNIAEKSVNAFSVSPGVVRTNLARYILNDRPGLKIVWFLFSPLIWYLLRTPRQGSETSIYCSLQTGLTEDEGFYFRNCEQIPLVAPHATSREDAAKLWALSEKMVAQWL